MELTWDEVGKRLYEAGVDRGVLYPINSEGVYDLGHAWNGLTTITESPSGAEANPQYADNIKYLNLLSAEEFGATVEAFTYPDAFAQCDGTAEPEPGVLVGQQGRRVFGLAYRTLIGNDLAGTDHGYKIHLIYGAQAAPSEKARATINDSPEATAFSWELTTTPVPVPGLKPAAHLVIDSTKVDPAKLEELETILYGSVGDDPRLPLPTEVIAIISDEGVVDVNLFDADNQPSFDQGTNVITLPDVTGVQWRIDGEDVADGAQPALGVGEMVEVKAVAQAGFNLQGDDTWVYAHEA